MLVSKRPHVICAGPKGRALYWCCLQADVQRSFCFIGIKNARNCFFLIIHNVNENVIMFFFSTEKELLQTFFLNYFHNLKFNLQMVIFVF